MDGRTLLVLGAAIGAVLALLLWFLVIRITEPAPTVTGFQPLREPGVGGRITAVSFQPGSSSSDPADGAVRSSPASSVLLAAGDMLGVARSADGGRSWQPSQGLLAYEMAEFTWDPFNADEVWVGSMSGPARSTDGGRTFSPARDGMDAINPGAYSSPVQRVVYLSATEVLAFGGSQRRWAEDNGQPEPYGKVWHASRPAPQEPWGPWQLRTTLPGNIVAATQTQGRVWAVVRGGDLPGVYRSDDGGATFTRTQAPAGNHGELSDLATDPRDANALWVSRAGRSLAADNSSGAPGGIYRSTDGGQRWIEVSPPLTEEGGAQQVSGFETLEASAAVPDGADAPVLYTADVGQNSKRTYRSTDGGETWTAILGAADDAGDQGQGQGQADEGDPPSTVGNDQLPLAYSGGADLYALAVDPADPFRILGGSQEHLLLGEGDADRAAGRNGGTEWTDVATTVTADGGFVGHGFSGLVATRAVFNPFRKGGLSLNAMDGGNLLHTTDGGTSWTRPLAALDPPIRNVYDSWMDLWFGAVDTTYADADTIYVLKGQIGWFAGIAKSFDGGDTFTLLDTPDNGLPEGIEFSDRQVTAIEALRRDEVVFTMDGCLWRSVDGGASWAAEQRSCSLGLGDLARDPAVPTHLFAQGRDGVFESLDGGRTFRLLQGPDGTSPGAAPSRGRLAVTSLGEGNVVLYASAMDSERSGLFRWDGSATGWTRVIDDTTPYGTRILDVSVDRTNPSRVAASVMDFPYHDQTYAPGVLVSEDGGATWRIEAEGLAMRRAAAVAWDPFTPGRLVVGTYGQGFYVATLKS